MKGENISLNFSLLVSIKKVNSDYMTFLCRQTLITLFLFWKKDSNINVAVLHGFIKKGSSHNVFQLLLSVNITLYTDFAKLFQVPQTFYLYVLHDNNEIELLQVIQ